MAEQSIESKASPFHAGEQIMQARMGVRAALEPWARRVIRPYMPAQHRAFYAALPYLIVAARDHQGRAWATMMWGQPGFVDTPDATTLRVGAKLAPGDALTGALVPGADLGVLGIELSTRRRNRVNGRVARWRGAGEGLLLQVDQSFGNCPQYIHERGLTRVESSSPPPPARRAERLDRSQRQRIRAADTLFIASGHRGQGEDAAFGMDASHRGGQPGFVHVDEDGRGLVIPDYAGNNHFNTVGNILLDPRVGLLFIDFEGGGLLQLTGRATVDEGSPEIATFPGARRLLRVRVDEVVELPGALPLRWTSDRGSVRQLRLLSTQRESEEVRALTFGARDGGRLPAFEAGQHLPLELRIPGRGVIGRSYSLSNGPSGEFYRISVKREPGGLASPWLHELEQGAIVQARAPAGDFVLEPGSRPVVLLSAGVGITPMLSMLHALAQQPQHRSRKVHFVHGARDGAHLPHAEELRLLSEARPEISLHLAFSQPRASDRLGRDYDSRGRLHPQHVAALLPTVDVDVYMCGPVPFMAAMQAGLEAFGVAAERIHSESFGPSGL